MAYDAEKFDFGSSRDHAPTTCAATRDPIARAAPVDPLTITDPKERLRYLADFIRPLPARFHSASAMRPLRLRLQARPACIGGWIDRTVVGSVTIDHCTPPSARRCRL
jgi:hypothetical protein